jgi:ribosome-associated protein
MTLTSILSETEKEMHTIPRKAKTPKRTKKSSKTISKKLLAIATTSLDNDKAQDVVVINLAGKTSFADYMVIASGTSQRHVATMAVHLRENLKTTGVKEIPLEGAEQNDWVLIDGGDVIVHLFRPEIREFYDLEKMWNSEMPQPGKVA